MYRFIYAIFFIFIIINNISCSNADSSADEEKAFTFFSTDSAVSKERIISLIDQSDKSIQVCSALLNDYEIADALINAKSRMINIEIVIDNCSFELPGTKILINSGIPVHPRATDDYMGSFFIIIDELKLITGSINFNSTSKKEICIIALFNDKTLTKNYLREFHILKTGQSPEAKDAEFDKKLGPSSKLYESGWYSVNQILLYDPFPETMSQVKGQWGDEEVEIYNTKIKFYFSPYLRSRRSYGYYTKNAFGTYIPASTDYSYTDRDTGNPVTEQRTDFINVIAPLLKNATGSIKVISSVLTEKILIDELLNAAGRGVRVEIYLDYDMTLHMLNNNSLSLKALKEQSSLMRLYKPYLNGMLSMNLISIDDNTFIISSSGLTRRSLTKNDSSFLIINNKTGMDSEIKKAIITINANSVQYNPDENYAGKYEKPEYMENI